jgi:Family of unknown function (DUF5995)
MSGGFPDDTTLATVVATLAQLPLAADDGIRFFNRVYTGVTAEVARRVSAGAFEDTDFMVTLDVIFAGLYLEAVRSPATAPRAWQVVFDKRTRTSIEPLRFALAGMNAHINRDLAVALDLACTRRGGTLARDSARCRDFVQINVVLETLMAQAKAELFSPLDDLVDAGLGRLDDLLEVWSIAAARDNAWTQGALLHQLTDPDDRAHHLHSIDRTASLLGRLILL